MKELRKSGAPKEYTWELNPRIFKIRFMDGYGAFTIGPGAGGVWWMNLQEAKDIEQNISNIYFISLYIPNNRATFLQDLRFQITSDTESFKVWYIVCHRAL